MNVSIWKNSRQSTNHDKCGHVLHCVNMDSRTKQVLFSDIDEVFDNIDQQQNVQHDTILHSQEQGIPKHVFENKHTCVDYLACMNDNKEGCGFIPASPLQLYTGDPTYQILFVCIKFCHKVIFPII